MADDRRVTPRGVGLVCALALLCACGILPASASAVELVVRRDAGLSAAERADLRADAGVAHARMLAVPDAELVTVPAGRERQALAALNADPDVRYAEPVVRYRVVSNDTFYDNLWGLENDGQPIGRDGERGRADADMDVPEAWGVSRGAGQTIAVVDTGIQETHPDLAGRIAAGARSFLGGSATDDNGHGTNVAGVIAAVADNGIGVAGVAPQATLLSLKALNASGDGGSAAISQALAFAGDAGIRVVNASISASEDAQIVRDAIAAHPQTLYVVAAGNDGANNDALPEYPCNYPLANIICVGGTTNQDEVASWSNYGATSVDVFAPGERIYTTQRNPTMPSIPLFGWEDGTSMATPMVAAEAALMLASRPNLSTASLRQLLLQSVDPIPSAVGRSATGGRANANKLLRAAVADADGDGVLDTLDNCPSTGNPSLADADADGAGDACDASPRGDDADGDAKPALDDRCPTVSSAEPDGCPKPVTPTVTPTATPVAAAQVVSLGVKVTPKRCKRPCKKAAKVTVKLTRTATVSVKVEQRVKRKGRWVWKLITVRALNGTASGRTLTVRAPRGRSLARGSYRVTATVAGKSKTRNFRV